MGLDELLEDGRPGHGVRTHRARRDPEPGTMCEEARNPQNERRDP